jgi:hypothetical protein
MLTWDTIFLLAIIFTFAYVWYESLRIRERIILHCHNLCRETNLQLLDQTVSLLTIAPRRTENGSLGFYRKYQFEVSENGVDRFSGFVSVLGSKIVESHLQGEAGQNIFHQGKSERPH